jgi:hypothetical protein
LRDQHVQIDGERIRFHFRGKSGKYHDIELDDRRLAVGALKRRPEKTPKEVHRLKPEEAAVLGLLQQRLQRGTDAGRRVSSRRAHQAGMVSLRPRRAHQTSVLHTNKPPPPPMRPTARA